MARRPVAGAARLGSVHLFVDVTGHYRTRGGPPADPACAPPNWRDVRPLAPHRRREEARGTGRIGPSSAYRLGPESPRSLWFVVRPRDRLGEGVFIRPGSTRWSSNQTAAGVSC